MFTDQMSYGYRAALDDIHDMITENPKESED